MDDDVGRLTNELFGRAAAICEVWNTKPNRRCEFGDQELDDIAGSVLGLMVILRATGVLELEDAA